MRNFLKIYIHVNGDDAHMYIAGRRIGKVLYVRTRLGNWIDLRLLVIE